MNSGHLPHLNNPYMECGSRVTLQSGMTSVPSTTVILIRVDENKRSNFQILIHITHP